MAEKSISLDDTRHVAKLARLALSEQDLSQLTSQLGSILHYVEMIGRLDVANVEPTAHPLPISNVLREDVAGESLPIEAVLANAPESDGPYFKVPKVLGGDEDSAG